MVYDEFYFLGHDGAWAVESQPMLRRNISLLAALLPAGFLHGLVFNLQDEENMLLRNLR
jgi:hypothetical protein